MAYTSFTALCEAAEQEHHGDLAQAALACEACESGLSREHIRARFKDALAVMRNSIAQGGEGKLRSRSGMTGGDGKRLLYPEKNAAAGIFGAHSLFRQVVGSAVATAEVNATMGRIVAAPTAGASGVLPGVLIPLAEAHHIKDEKLIDSLAVAGAIGAIYAAGSTLSGAAGGCQAEVGAGASMAAGALCYMLGGTSAQVGHAAGIAMQGQLGLVCDPVGGLVEVPCVMRNLTGAAVALAGAEAALAGIEFPISFDDVVLTAARVGASLPPSLRETAQGGLAITPSAQRLVS